MTDEQLAHIYRAALPWRDEPPLTECGREPRDAARVWTLDEARAQLDRLGQQRFAMVVCMTCAHTANRYAGWDRDPSGTVERHARYGRRTPQRDQLDRELRALALLAEAHRDEFDALVSGLADAPSLDARRRARRR